MQNAKNWDSLPPHLQHSAFCIILHFDILHFAFCIYTPPVRILGVDPGSVATGFGVIDSIRGKLSVIEQGSIRSARSADLSTRLQRIHQILGEVIQRTRPMAAAVETPFSGLNPKSLIQLSHARGVILLAAREGGLELFEYSPRSVKSAVVGYGAAEKEQVEKMVRLLLGLEAGLKIDADAADALAVAICHAHSFRMQEHARDAR